MYLCNAEIKQSDWMFQVMWLRLTNQNASFQYSIVNSKSTLGQRLLFNLCPTHRNLFHQILRKFFHCIDSSCQNPILKSLFYQVSPYHKILRSPCLMKSTRIKSKQLTLSHPIKFCQCIDSSSKILFCEVSPYHKITLSHYCIIQS